MHKQYSISLEVRNFEVTVLYNIELELGCKLCLYFAW